MNPLQMQEMRISDLCVIKNFQNVNLKKLISPHQTDNILC